VVILLNRADTRKNALANVVEPNEGHCMISMGAMRLLLGLVGLLSAGAEIRAQEVGVRQSMLPRAELRVGVNPQAPPLIYVRDAKIAGLEADFARALAQYLGVPLHFVVMEFDELIPALVDGKVDIIMSGISATDLRAVRIDFAEPYVVTGQMPLIRARDLSRYPTTMALMNTQVYVGVEAGTTGDFLVSERFTYAERVEFDSPLAAADALAAERIGMVVADAPTVWWLAAQRQSAGLTPVPAILTREELAWGVAKDNPELLGRANAFLEELRKTGQLQRFLDRWMPAAARFR